MVKFNFFFSVLVLMGLGVVRGLSFSVPLCLYIWLRVGWRTVQDKQDRWGLCHASLCPCVAVSSGKPVALRILGRCRRVSSPMPIPRTHHDPDPRGPEDPEPEQQARMASQALTRLYGMCTRPQGTATAQHCQEMRSSSMEGMMWQEEDG